jgi:hypothetical protein
MEGPQRGIDMGPRFRGGDDGVGDSERSDGRNGTLG